jgi:hypothetical protein
MRLWLLPQAIGHPKGAKSHKKKASQRMRGFLINLDRFRPKNRSKNSVLLPICTVFVTFLFHDLGFSPG